MIKCSEECEPLCDFCIHFIEDDKYEDDGYCSINNKPVSRCDACEDSFHCFRAE